MDTDEKAIAFLARTMVTAPPKERVTVNEIPYEYDSNKKQWFRIKTTISPKNGVITAAWKEQYPNAAQEEKLSVVIAPGTETIGAGAFLSCRNLATVSFASDGKLKTIEQYAFNDCSALQDISIPQGVETLGLGTFAKCTALRSIRIPQSVTSLGVMAFFNSGLDTIIVEPGSTLPVETDQEKIALLKRTMLTAPAGRRVAVNGVKFGYDIGTKKWFTAPQGEGEE
jgi:hypothetical protein